jgi:hypothetical protein
MLALANILMPVVMVLHRCVKTTHQLLTVPMLPLFMCSDAAPVISVVDDVFAFISPVKRGISTAMVLRIGCVQMAMRCMTIMATYGPSLQTDGKVDQTAGMLSEDVQEKGYCLTCVSVPQTDCHIQLIEEVSDRVYKPAAVIVQTALGHPNRLPLVHWVIQIGAPTLNHCLTTMHVPGPPISGAATNFAAAQRTT